MMTSIRVNDLLGKAADEPLPTGEVVFNVVRVLYIDLECNTVFLIDRYDPKALPYRTDFIALEAALSTGTLRHFEDLEREELLYPDDHFLKRRQGYRQALQRRDTAWAIIADYVRDPRLYHRATRGQIVRELETKTGLTNDTILAYFRRYWQRGQIKNALLADYKNCGSNQNRKNENKRGRRPTDAPQDTVLENNNVTPEIKKRLLMGYAEFYKNGASLEFALQRTREKYFAIGTRPVLRDGKIIAVPVLPPEDKLPSRTQFIYHCHQVRDDEKVAIGHLGADEFNQNWRPVTGNLSIKPQKAGEFAELDATPFPIRLVSRVNPALEFKNPTVYLLVCNLTHLVMGINATLDGESYIEGVVTIENSVTDKVAYAHRYGIEISSAQWPCQHYPEHVTADQAAMRGYSGDRLGGPLDIRLELIQGKRPDLKGIVEGLHALFKKKSQDIADRQSGLHHTALDGVLTMDEFRAALIEAVVEYNTTTFLDPKDYPIADDMLRDAVVMAPAPLWLWSLDHRGEPPSEFVEVVRRNLLPLDTLTISRFGYTFKGWEYDCPYLLQNDSLAQAAQRGSTQLTARYDPRLIDAIYLDIAADKEGEESQPDRRKRKPILATLAEKHAAYRGLSFAEAEALVKRTRSQKPSLDAEKHQMQAERHAVNAAKIASGKARKRQAQQEEAALTGKPSKTARRQAMPENKKLEAQDERPERAWQLETDTPSPTTNQDTPPSRPGALAREDNYISMPDLSEELKRMREEVRHGRQ